MEWKAQDKAANAVKKGRIVKTITVLSVEGMYNLVVDELIPGGQDAQKNESQLAKKFEKS